MRNATFLTGALILLSLIVTQTEAQNPGSTNTFCNPLNLNYRYQLAKPSRREAADPSVIQFRGKYFLFASKSGGYWASDNLLEWKFITSPDLPWEDYAPTVVAIRDTLFFLATNWFNNSKSLYKSGDPLSGKWQIAVKQFKKEMSDPDLFLDDDGRLYFYYGTSNVTPIYGVELNATTFDLLGDPVPCLNSDKNNYGWERSGDYNTRESRPYLEGAWMTKYKSRYYLQYAVPGTEFKSYADAVYVGNSPLGPFQIAENSPVSYKPEGFIAGAGHGSTFQDNFGNYWHIATMTISVKHNFERRLGLFPAFFDKDGNFYTYTGFGDFPHIIPKKKINGPLEYQPTWMLLSFNKPVEVSSTSPKHPKENATDENIRTWWSAISGHEKEWISIDLHQVCRVHAVQINFADDESSILGRPDSIHYQYLLEYSTDNKHWRSLSNKRQNQIDAPHDYLSFTKGVQARYVRLTNYHVPSGNFSISDLRIFGRGGGKAPQPVSSVAAIRDSSDSRNVTLSWKTNKDAIGYNVRYGTGPDKLFQNYQVYSADSITIHSLRKTLNYFYTIDAFNENGITKGTMIIKDN